MAKNRKGKRALDGIGNTISSLQTRPLNGQNLEDQDKLVAVEGVDSGSAELKRPRPDDEGDENWEVVDRHAKKKKKKDKYPELVWSDRSRLTSKVKIADVRDLVLYVQADGTAPQWVSVSHRANIKKIVVVMVPGLEDAMFHEDVDMDSYNSVNRVPDKRTPDDPQDNFPRPLSRAKLPNVLGPFADMFSHIWPLKAPGDDRCLRMYSPVSHFLTAPSPKHKEKGGKIATAKEPSGWKNIPTRITEFLASRDELLENEFKLHPAFGPDEDGITPELPSGWIATRVDSLEAGNVPEQEIEQGSVTAGRQVLAIDCEMCMTGPDEYSLTRISILNWGGDVVMDELVKPDNPIIDYVTQYSGITPEMLAPVTTTLSDIQNKLLDIITPHTILLGHSLDSDLKAMQLVHPFIADTSLLFPHPRGPPLKQGLKYLSQKYMSREIQKGHGTGGHNSIEDARACLDLVRQKCEKGKLWGVADTQGESLFRRLGRAGVSHEQAKAATEASAASDGAPKQEIGKTSAAVDWGDVAKGPGSAATHRINCKSDEDVVSGIIRAVQGDADGLEIPLGGVDFIWGRMRELEAHQGWWKPNGGDRANNGSGSRETPIDAPMGLIALDSPRSMLEAHLSATTARLVRIQEALPPCTALLVLSGSGDPREMSRLQTLQARAKKEYRSGVKWDELTVKWTDDMDQALIRSVRHAKAGIGFFTIK